MDAADIETADRLTRRRARMATVLGAIFLVTQAASFERIDAGTRPGMVHLAAWTVWAAALLLFLVTGGGLARNAVVRGLLNDETTRANRLRALAVGFWFAIAAALLVYGLTFVEPITAREGARLVVTLAVAATLIRFGVLERRALAGG